MEYEYTFEEIQLAGEGVLANGVATLVSGGEGYEGEFYVSRIVFQNGPTVDLKTMYPHSDEAFFFRIIAEKIEDSADAQAEWAEFEAGVLRGEAA